MTERKFQVGDVLQWVEGHPLASTGNVRVYATGSCMDRHWVNISNKEDACYFEHKFTLVYRPIPAPVTDAGAAEYEEIIALQSLMGDK